jgi:anti-sigma-K factor RskA
MTEAGNRDPNFGGDDVVAAEYVLGVLSAEERAIAAVRIEAELEFARLVDHWEVLLAPMAGAYKEVEPPASLKQALDHRLFDAADAASRNSSLWTSLAFWRGLAAAALVALLVYAAVPFVAPPGSVPQERLVAALAPHDSDVHYLAVIDPGAGDIGLSHVSGERAEGRDFELWLIEGENAPESLGVIPVGETLHLPLSEEARAKLGRGGLLAVSLEPQGGSPTGQPSGPVVAAGDLRAI